MAGSITENGTKLSACKRANASSWVRSLHSILLSSNDFNRRRGVAMRRFDLCCPDSYAGRWRRWDVEQSPFTAVDIGLYGRRPCTIMLSKALHVGRKTSHWLERSSCRFLVTLIIRIPSSGSQYFTSFNHLLCGFVTEGLLQKPLQLISPPADWSCKCRDVTAYAYATWWRLTSIY